MSSGVYFSDFFLALIFFPKTLFCDKLNVPLDYNHIFLCDNSMFYDFNKDARAPAPLFLHGWSACSITKRLNWSTSHTKQTLCSIETLVLYSHETMTQKIMRYQSMAHSRPYSPLFLIFRVCQKNKKIGISFSISFSLILRRPLIWFCQKSIHI